MTVRRPGSDEAIPVATSVPGLIVLVGAAGAGKSTLAARLVAPDETLSSDALRERVSGDPADQRATGTAFRILHREVGRRLSAGRLVLVDATNVERPARLDLVRIGRRAGVAPVAIVLALAADVVHARNAARPGRIVPATVVDRHLSALARLGPPGSDEMRARLAAEGVGAVVVVTAYADLDRLAVVRTASRPPTPGQRPVLGLPDDPERPGPELHPDPVPEIDIGPAGGERRLLIRRAQDHDR